MQNRKLFYAFGIIIFLLVLHFLFLSAPNSFVPGTVVRIDKGMGLRAVSLRLKEEHVIRSRTIFEAFVILFGGEKHILYSNYLFEDELSVYSVANRIANGKHFMAPVVVTIPEGFNKGEIAEAFSAKLANFDKAKFLSSPLTKEGYLFPDTYFFLSLDNEQNVLKAMTENFQKKIKDLQPFITKAGKTEKDIIVMASLIEGEAKGEVDREIISGILWKRLARGMPLQVDAAPDTYKTKGLPKNPISNPGLLSIKAAIEPKESSYFYYLHDQEGNIHYAVSFEEHRLNVLKYLK